MSERDAVRDAIRCFGRARVVARLMYEAYSKGSWSEAAITSLPHLIIAGLFVTHLWHHLVLAPIAFASIVLVTLFGWWHGKPNWLYSWVGYSLLPLLIIGYSSRFVAKQTVSFLLWEEGLPPNVWLLGVYLIFCFLSLWIIVSTTIRVVKRDWILASLMLVPLPILGSWIFKIEQLGGLFQNAGATLYQWDVAMASVLIVLGVTSATFVRLRQRVLKVGALITIGSISLAMVSHNLWGSLGLFGMLTLSLSMLAFLLIPALVEARIGHGEQKGEAWWSGDWIKRPSMTKQ
ncbi:MAG: hypothetical protein ACE5LA_00540 [Dehalococcoidales bacterium]